jgi:Lar family restriction alleviation protein
MVISRCPFCGLSVAKVQSVVLDNATNTSYSLYCTNCHSRGPTASSEDFAIIVWNTRVIPDREMDALQHKDLEREEDSYNKFTSWVG